MLDRLVRGRRLEEDLDHLPGERVGRRAGRGDGAIDVGLRSSQRELRGEQLQRYLSLQPEVIGPVDDTHPASADSLLDAVPGEDSADPNVGDG